MLFISSTSFVLSSEWHLSGSQPTNHHPPPLSHTPLEGRGRKEAWDLNSWNGSCFCMAALPRKLGSHLYRLLLLLLSATLVKSSISLSVGRPVGRSVGCPTRRKFPRPPFCYAHASRSGLSPGGGRVQRPITLKKISFRHIVQVKHKPLRRDPVR